MDQREKAKVILEELNRLAVAVGADLPKEKQAVYLEDLAGYPLDAMLEAFKTARQTKKWMPKICELIELIEEACRNRPALPTPDRLLLEEKRADPETVKRCLSEILTKIGNTDKPKLEGEEAIDFEEKRKVAKEQAEELVSVYRSL